VDNGSKSTFLHTFSSYARHVHRKFLTLRHLYNDGFVISAPILRNMN